MSSPVELEIRFLEQPLAHLKPRDPAAEATLVSSIASLGQQVPILVVADGPTHQVIDGHRRIRALERLSEDVVRATVWDLPLTEALIMHEQSCPRSRASAVEQGLLFRELVRVREVSVSELARRLGRTSSWVHRRLGLVERLPAQTLEHVLEGRMCPHVAEKYLLPLARAHSQSVRPFAEVLAEGRFAVREARILYDQLRHGGPQARRLVLSHPRLVLEREAERRQAGLRPTRLADVPSSLGALLHHLSETLSDALTTLRGGDPSCDDPRVRQLFVQVVESFQRFEEAMNTGLEDPTKEVP